MERLTVKRKDGRWALANSANMSNVEMMDKIPLAINRLAAYEDAEEQGRLVMLPCKVGELVWVCYPMFKRITRVVYMAKSDILDDVECGAIICRTREESVAALKEEDEDV